MIGGLTCHVKQYYYYSRIGEILEQLSRASAEDNYKKKFSFLNIL